VSAYLAPAFGARSKAEIDLLVFACLIDANAFEPGKATLSIDQVLALLATVEAGSFTAAAKRLGRATSAISYAIDTLED
jgi:hypothetical protein